MKTPIKLFLLIAILAALIFHWPEPHSYIPAKLWGVWKTDQAKYTDRYLDISEAIFSLGQGQQRVQVYFIEQVDIASDGPQERYTIRYRDQEGGRAPLQTFTFFFRPDKEGDRIFLNNQENIFWYRESDPEPNGAGPEDDRP